MRADEDLARELTRGNDDAFVALYNRYKNPLYLFCIRMLDSSETAKDIVQAAFLKVYERRNQLHSTDRFKAWLFTIARNDCLTQLRGKGDSVHLNDELEDSNSPAAQTRVEREEESELINRAVGKLRPEYREVLILREYENLSYAEIAEITESTESAVKSKLFKARRRLYDLLRPFFPER